MVASAHDSQHLHEPAPTAALFLQTETLSRTNLKKALIDLFFTLKEKANRFLDEAW